MNPRWEICEDKGYVAFTSFKEAKAYVLAQGARLAEVYILKDDNPAYYLGHDGRFHRANDEEWHTPGGGLRV